ncbi:E3 ubiquitin-protein ligase FANCL [Nylanderia fulva]|uniref:E3 ubiquitin-protein ligase FANCL n=1 Tax=Nylanderia fulva TaxID=613905 RepID=UPI0010FACF83|nr:E3 ubiquitin-protein ligase FANCL [Nylanderia fulva]
MVTKQSYDYGAILERHPEIILVSESPVTWYGFLIISHSLCTAYDFQSPRVKLKLIMSAYPSFEQAHIEFGRQIASLRNKEFHKRVKQLMTTFKSEQTVSSFLTQLQSLIGEYMHNTKTLIPNPDTMRYFLQELKAALHHLPDMKISSDQNLSIIKLHYRDVSITLQRCNNTELPWTVIASDLPNIPSFEGFEKNVTNLSVAKTKFKWQVEILRKAWEQLEEIDENCWVIDPLKPNKSHMYRRIHLSQSLSVTIIIDDPSNPLPIIKFLGSDNEVKRQMDDVSNNIHKWNYDCSIFENLKMLLNMYEFSDPESIEEKNVVINNRECGICFSDELSDKICNNEKCMKHFHSACLSRWLQTNSGNQVVFDHIYGTCPYCKEKISCSIKQ